MSASYYAPEQGRYDNVTFLLCLPRSRSAWLSMFLKPVAWTMHDPLKACSSIEELAGKVDEVLFLNPARPVFIADTAAVLFFADISKVFLNARFLFIERHLADVSLSLEKQGMEFPPSLGAHYVHAMHMARLTSRARRDFRMEIGFDEIDNRLLNIWRFVGNGLHMDRAYAERMRGSNIQVPFEEQHAAMDRRKVRRLFSTIGITL